MTTRPPADAATAPEVQKEQARARTTSSSPSDASLIQIVCASPHLRLLAQPQQRCVLEEFKRCSESHLWQLMMSFYDRKGPDSWSQGIVPHFITCNAFIGRSYAKARRSRARPRVPARNARAPRAARRAARRGAQRARPPRVQPSAREKR